MKAFNPSKITSKYRANLILSTYKDLLRKDDKILDIGCGTGVVSLYLEKNLDIKIIGCDIKNYLTHPLAFVLIKEDKKLPFRTKSFDIVMLNDVLHHLEKHKQYEILKEALRVGKKVLIFEAKPTLFGKLFDILLNKLHYGDLKAPLSFRNIEDWSNIFRKLNSKYTVRKIKTPIIYPFSHIAFSLIELSVKSKH